MIPPKPYISIAGQKCPICLVGTFELVQRDHLEKVAEDNPVMIRNVWVNHCEHCGEVVYPSETVQFVEHVVAEQQEHLTQHEIERIREDLNVPKQDEMSEILGLGAKTYHKWENGSQFPTRSMCYYIRVLAEFPQAFEWLRQRAWRGKNRLINCEVPGWNEIFPDLESDKVPESVQSRQINYSKNNPALGLHRVAFPIK